MQMARIGAFPARHEAAQFVRPRSVESALVDGAIHLEHNLKISYPFLLCSLIYSFVVDDQPVVMLQDCEKCLQQLLLGGIQDDIEARQMIDVRLQLLVFTVD